MRLGAAAAVIVVATLVTQAAGGLVSPRFVVMVLLVSRKHAAPTHTNKGD